MSRQAYTVREWHAGSSRSPGRSYWLVERADGEMVIQLDDASSAHLFAEEANRQAATGKPAVMTELTTAILLCQRHSQFPLACPAVRIQFCECRPPATGKSLSISIGTWTCPEADIPRFRQEGDLDIWLIGRLHEASASDMVTQFLRWRTEYLYAQEWAVGIEREQRLAFLHHQKWLADHAGSQPVIWE